MQYFLSWFGVAGTEPLLSTDEPSKRELRGDSDTEWFFVSKLLVSVQGADKLGFSLVLEWFCATVAMCLAQLANCRDRWAFSSASSANSFSELTFPEARDLSSSGIVGREDKRCILPTSSRSIPSWLLLPLLLPEANIPGMKLVADVRGPRLSLDIGADIDSSSWGHFSGVRDLRVFLYVCTAGTDRCLGQGSSCCVNLFLLGSNMGLLGLIGDLMLPPLKDFLPFTQNVFIVPLPYGGNMEDSYNWRF